MCALSAFIVYFLHDDNSMRALQVNDQSRMNFCIQSCRIQNFLGGAVATCWRMRKASEREGGQVGRATHAAAVSAASSRPYTRLVFASSRTTSGLPLAKHFAVSDTNLLIVNRQHTSVSTMRFANAFDGSLTGTPSPACHDDGAANYIPISKFGIPVHDSRVQPNEKSPRPPLTPDLKTRNGTELER